MRRLFRNTCFGLLLSLAFCMVAILTVFAVLFQQTQAVTSNTAATVEALATPFPTLPLSMLPPSEGEVIIQIETSAPILDATSVVAPPTEPISTSSPIAATTAMTLTPDLPRHSGTSSYPVTLTVEAMLALTHVAGYQAGVAATRTAIAAESARIFATLTANAPLPTVSAP